MRHQLTNVSPKLKSIGQSTGEAYHDKSSVVSILQIQLINVKIFLNYNS